MKTKSHTPTVATSPFYHLVTKDSRGKPLCSEDSPNALIGSYVEHVEASNGEARWVREILGPGGKPVSGCPRCLNLYPAELKQITPFAVMVTVNFEPDTAFSGYRPTVSAFAQIGDTRTVVEAYPSFAFITAKRLQGLQFSLGLNCQTIVPWVNKANRE